MRRAICEDARKPHGLDDVMTPTRRLSASLRSRACTVSHPADSHNELGTLRVTLDLRAQTLHVNVHEPGVGRVTVAPHLFEELFTRKDLPGRASQRHQEVEFEGRQSDDMDRSCNVSPSSTWASSRPRKRARTRATSSLGLKGLGT